MSKYKKQECKKLIDCGLSLVVADQHKKPLWSNWQNKKVDIKDFAKYYTKDAAQITGVVCDGDIECIDVDLKILPESKRDSEFKKMFNFFNDNIDDFAKKFFIQRTPSKGFHLVYKCKYTEGNQKIAFTEVESNKFECLIETRGTGGYFGIYKGLNIIGDLCNIPMITQDDREILMHCCESFNEKIQIQKVPKKALKDFKESTLSSWDDYDAKTDIFEVVKDHFKIVGNTPKGHQIKRIGGSKSSHHSGYIYTDRNLLFLFSGNSMFPAEEGLSPSAALAHRDFNGDFSRCAKYLFDQGYGERVEKPKPDPSPQQLPSGEFPIEIFPQWVNEYLSEIHQATGIPIDFLCCSFLFSFSIVCGNSYGLPTRTNSLEYPIIWMCLVARAGRFKSPAISEMIIPLRKLNSEMHKEFSSKLADLKQAKENAKKGQNVDEQPPKKQMTVVDDVTFEALVDIHQNNNHGLGYVKDELDGMMSQFSKYSGAGSDVSNWLSLFNGGAVSLERKQAKSAYLEKTFVSIIGGVQPEIIHNIINDTNRSNGFVDRMLFVNNDDPVPLLTKEKVRAFKKKNFIDTMQAAFASLHNVTSSALELSASADDQLIEYINQLRTNQNNFDLMSIDGLNAKMQTYLHRFTALLHIMKQIINKPAQPQMMMTVDTFVQVETVKDAWKLALFFIEQGGYVREKTAVDREKMKVMKNLEMTGSSTRSELAIEMFKRYNGDITFDELARLVGYSGRSAVRKVVIKDDACRKLLKKS